MVNPEMKQPYYETELGRLYHGDCLEIMPRLEQVDVLATDPPWGNPLNCKNDWQAKIINFLPVVFEKLVDGGRAYSFWNAKDIPYFQVEFTNFFKLKNIIIVYKQNFVTQPWDKAAFQYQWEPLFYGIKGKTDLETREISCKFNEPCFDVWPSVKPQSNFIYDKRIHDAQKPIYVLYRIVLFSGWGIVLDPFLGSGTTAVACERLSRRWIGIEIEEKYCEIAAKRIENERKQRKLF